MAFLLDAQDPSRLERQAKSRRCDESGIREVLGRTRISRSRSFERSSKMSPERASNRSGHRHSRAPASSITPMRSMRSDFGSRSPNRMTGRHREEPRSVRSRRSMAAGSSCRRSDAERRRTKPASTWTTRFSRSMISEFDPINSMLGWSSIVAGDRVSILVARRDRLIRLDVHARSRALEVVAARGRSIGHTRDNGPGWTSGWPRVEIPCARADPSALSAPLPRGIALALTPTLENKTWGCQQAPRSSISR